MGALDGLQVIELTNGLCGSVVGMHLADHGAEVIKVEPPGGDPWRERRGFPLWNRGKRSVVVDKTHAGQCAALERLIRGADICLVTDDGTLRSYGVDQAGLLRAHRRLVLVALAPYAGVAPWAKNLESAGLLTADLGMSLRQFSTDDSPVDSVTPAVLYLQAAWAAACAVAAMVEREHSGYGQQVIVSGVDAVKIMAAASIAMSEDAPTPHANFGPAGRHPTYTRYRCADGKWLATGALGAWMEEAFLELLDLRDVLDDPRIAGVTGRVTELGNTGWVGERIAERIVARPSQHWVDTLMAARIPVGVLGIPWSWLDDEQIKAIGMRVEVDDPERGPVVMPGSPITLYGTPADPSRRAPTLGEHDVADLLRPCTEAPAGRPPLRPGPLAGYQILSFGTFVALPYSGRLLGSLGAEVVRIEPTGGDPWRKQSFAFTGGALSCALNVKDEAGHSAFLRLVERADVVMSALRPGTGDRIGIGYDSLAKANPEIIAVSLSAYGDVGPKRHLGGVDVVMQGESGLMIAQGGEEAPCISTSAIIDLNTAALLAMGTTLALLARVRSGRGQRATAALAASAAYVQCGELTDYTGAPPRPKGSKDYKGSHAFDHTYAAADGWVRIDAGSDRPALDPLTPPIDHRRLATDPEATLADWIAKLPAAQAVSALNAAGISAVAARRLDEVLRDPRLVMAEFGRIFSSDEGGYFTLPGRPAIFSRTPVNDSARAPGVGEHTRSVFTRAGLDPAELAALAHAEVIFEGEPMPQALPTITYR